MISPSEEIDALEKRYQTLHSNEWTAAYERYRAAYNSVQDVFNWTSTNVDKLQAARSKIDSVRQRLAELQGIQDEIKTTLDKVYEIYARASHATQR